MNALRFVFLALAAGVLGILGWRSMPDRPPPPPVGAPMGALEAAMRAAPPAALAAMPGLSALRPPAAEMPAEFAAFFGRLRSDFPNLAASAAGRPTPDGADAGIWDALRDVEQAGGVLAAAASPAALDRFFDARSAVLDGLAPAGAKPCIDFLYGETGAALIAFTAAHRGLVGALADRTLDAIAEGRGHPRDRAAPTDADLDALSAGLAERGLPAEVIGFLVDGTMPDPPLPDARLCAAGQTYLSVLRGLPSDARARIYGLAAELLARS